jgi:anti-sigma factor RsiW
MRKLNDDRLDELLVAYVDGELDERQRTEMEEMLASDAALRERAARLAESAGLIRAAFDETVRETLPEQLIAAARGEMTPTPTHAPLPVATVLPFRPKAGKPVFLQRRWWIGVAAAASVGGLIVGAGVGYVGRGAETGTRTQAAAISSSTASWLDNVAGYHKMFVAATNNDRRFVDFASNGDNGELTKQISAQIAQQGVHVPDLKPWGLNFQGVRFLVVEGRPAAQFLYTTDNKAIGPLTIVMGSSKRPDAQPSLDQRQDVNVLYWRYHGHAYAIVGQADSGYMWNLAKDIAWQFDGI